MTRRGLLLPSAFVLGALAVLLALGTWQIERKNWKEALIAAMDQRLAAEPAELPAPQAWLGLTQDGAEFRRVRVRVDFGGGDALVYTSGSPLRDDVKAPGYFVFSAGRLPGGERIVVNRGYVRDKTYPVQSGVQEIIGYLRWPEASPLFVTDYDASAGVFYVRDHRLMARQRGWGDVAPFYIEQEAPVPPGGVPHPANLRVNLPNNHLQYAITWYALALALIVIYILYHRAPAAAPAPANRRQG